MDFLHTACPAKLNLALSVGAPDPETGMHPIASWMVALQLTDQLNVARGEGDENQFDIAFADAQRKVDWPVQDDLVVRAHRLMEDEVGRRMVVSVQLRKHIPAGAGLGGGSSDAAGMLVALDQLFKLHAGRDGLIDLAMQLGSDVAFGVCAMLGETSSLVTGLGETVEPLAITEPIHLMLAFPEFGSPTGQVYTAFDRGGDSGEADVQRVCALAQQQPINSDQLFNDLAEPACHVQPALREAQSHLAKVIQRPVHITGSGSTLFVICADADEAQRLAEQAGDEAGLIALATRTVAPVH